jgi:hypothetical protein
MTTVIINRAELGLPELQACDAQYLTQPQRLNLHVYRGDSGRFRVSVTDADGEPIDLTAATWDADIRKTALDDTTVGSFVVTPVDINSIDVILTAPLSRTLDDSPYVWDLEMTLGVEVTTLLVGELVVDQDVSRTP